MTSFVNTPADRAPTTHAPTAVPGDMAGALRVLLVEDSADDARLIAERLAEAHHELTLRRVDTEAEMQRALREGAWDVVVCAHPMRGFGPTPAPQLLRAHGVDLPVIVVSSVAGEDRAVEAIKQGADDYVMKPGFARLVPAVERGVAEAASRRSRAEAERQLRESEEHFRRLFDLASVGLAEIDPTQARCVRVNRALCEISGYPADELLALPLTAFSRPDQRDAHRAAFERVVRGEAGVGAIEGELVRRDGSLTWVRVNLNIQQDAAGRPMRVLAALEDITPRKLVEEDQRRLIKAVEQAAEAIVITDTSPRIVYVNPAFERTSGYTRAEAIGQNPRILKSGQHGREFYERMWAALVAGTAWSGLLVNRRKDGTLFYEEATISPVFDAAGKVINYVAVKRDVTYERQVEEQFRQSQKLEAIGQLAGGIAHDFNNILSVIKGHAELLEMAGSSAAIRDSADEITRAAGRAAGLTRQLLLFSRRQALQLSAADLNDVVSNMSRMLERILGEDIEVQFRYSGSPLPIHVDTGMIDQVLLNLAVNSRDAMPRGGRLQISTGSVECAEGEPAVPSGARPGSYACLTVTDSGAGIPPDVLPHVFEPFFTTKEVGKGTGLGLATVLGIVQQHNGWVDVRSEPGQGTTVTVCIPKTVPPPTHRNAPHSLASMPGGEETILLVEDDVALRRLVRSILSLLGYRVLEASSGRDALAVWTQHQHEVRLLLTDLVMPDGMSGLELARLLLGHNPRLKVIYSSGYSPDIAEQEVALLEGVNFLTKPYSPQALAEAVRARLSEPD